jgi:FkbH-like protein
MVAEPGLTETLRALVGGGRFDEAWGRVQSMVKAADDPSAYDLARAILRTGGQNGWAPPAARDVRLAVLSTYEATELAEHVGIACAAFGISTRLYAAPYGQLEQELLIESSALSAFEPTHVLIAPTTADLGFPELAEDADRLLDEAEARWRMLWDRAKERGARVLQHAFVVPDETPLGHLSLRLRGSRVSLVRELNARLGAAAGSSVLLVDCERLASRLGKKRWDDPRLWYAARRPYSQSALQLLARDTAAVLAGDLGLAARCLVVDLDNTLWGGLVAEEGWEGISVGEGPDGEAHAAFQDYLLGLSRRGMLLAVASKNDFGVAREPFHHNPKMRLAFDDFAVFVADWRRKPEQLVEISDRLGLGLESLVFVDDNPAECAEVASTIPEVETIPLDCPPSEFVRRLAACGRLEARWITAEDLERRDSYAARAQAARVRAETTSLEDFWRSLDMRARVRPIDGGTIERATQLVQKTNQFNLTLRRRSQAELERLSADPSSICMLLELEDRFANHGLVGLAIAVPDEDDPSTVVIDTLLLSCRVIGRTAEIHLISHLARAALAGGFTHLRGEYVPGPRNGLVAGLYPEIGFSPLARETSSWTYELAAGPLESLYIMDTE